MGKNCLFTFLTLKWNFSLCSITKIKSHSDRSSLCASANNGKERKGKSLSRVQPFATPWTVAYQAPPFMKFSRQEYWSGLPFPSPGIFLTQQLNLGLPHCRQMLYHLSHQQSPANNRRCIFSPPHVTCCSCLKTASCLWFLWMPTAHSHTGDPKLTLHLTRKRHRVENCKCE